MFVADLTQIAQQAAYESMRRAFAVTGGGSGARWSGRLNGRPRGSHAPKRRSNELAELRARFLDHVRAHPGLRIEQINQALGTTTKELKLPVSQMLNDGELSTKGQKRATTYFVGKKMSPTTGSAVNGVKGGA